MKKGEKKLFFCFITFSDPFKKTPKTYNKNYQNQYPSAKTRTEILGEWELAQRQQHLKGRKSSSPMPKLGMWTKEVSPVSTGPQESLDQSALPSLWEPFPFVQDT